MFVIIDIILLFLSTTIIESIGQSTVIPVPNRDNPRTVTGVSPFPIFHKQVDLSLKLAIDQMCAHSNANIFVPIQLATCMSYL